MVAAMQDGALAVVGGRLCTGLVDVTSDLAALDSRGFWAVVLPFSGVPICAPEAIDDPKAKLKLSAGRHVLDGTQALGYVRARKTLGDGSDLGRIARQQAFLSSVVQEATRSSLLVRPDKLFGFLDAATRSLTTDEQFDLGTMKDLASSVKDIGVTNIQFVTVPVQPYPADPNRVEWAPGPNPIHSPSVQYFRLWRDFCPGRATFEISYCSYAAASSRSMASRYMSAASSSAATAHLDLVIDSRSGEFG